MCILRFRQFYTCKRYVSDHKTRWQHPIPRSGKKSDTVSLLKTLNIKDDMKFYNTAYEAVDPEFMFNLVGFVTVPTKNVKEHLHSNIFIFQSLKIVLRLIVSG